MRQKIKQYKGGSLSGTFLMMENNRQFVAKYCSLTEEREYGLNRLFSQKSKMATAAIHFPALFPKILDIGIEEGQAYLDLEYLEGYVCLTDYLLNDAVDPQAVEAVFGAVYDAFRALTNVKNGSTFSASALHLYFQQEIRAALDYFAEHIDDGLATQSSFEFNGQTVNNLLHHCDYEKVLEQLDIERLDLCESLSHGNLTIENIMVHPATLAIKFIDCYDENFFHHGYNDLSQLLQCARYKYCLLTRTEPIITDNSIRLSPRRTGHFDHFCQLLEQRTAQDYNADEQMLINLFALSQFTRMLPFKLKGNNHAQALGFFALACQINQSLMEKVRS